MSTHASPPVVIRPLTDDDIPAFLDLIGALADYEHLPRPDADARSRLAADARAQPATFQVLLAHLDGVVVGYALFFMTYSTFLARPTLYLEDLFVQPEFRSRGAGTALFRHCAWLAVQRGCGRMEWQVLDWNAPALAFYEAQGAHRLAEWLPCRLTGSALEDVAALSYTLESC